MAGERQEEGTRCDDEESGGLEALSSFEEDRMGNRSMEIIIEETAAHAILRCRARVWAE